jgi:hypothetical protein
MTSTIGARLVNDGTLITAGEFDETHQSTHSIKATGVFADELDEITLPAGIPSGGSIQFNGTNQYITVLGDIDFGFGTGDFTIEGWFFLRSTAHMRLWYFPGGDTLEVSDGVLYYWDGTDSSGVITSGPSAIPQQQWFHVALEKHNGVVNCYINGQSHITDDTPYSSTTSRAMAIGADLDGNNPLYGYATNIRVVKGIAVYRGEFDMPVESLSDVQNTVLLMKVSNQTDMLLDSSSTNKQITSYGSAPYNAITPLTTVYNGAMKQLKSGTLQVAKIFDEVTTIS